MKPPVSVKSQVLERCRNHSLREVAAQSGIPLSTVKTIKSRSGAFRDNQALRALFTFPPIRPSEPTALPCLPFTPAQSCDPYFPYNRLELSRRMKRSAGLQTKGRKNPVFQCISAEEMTMKVDQSAVLLQSQHVGASLHTSKTTLRAWIGGQRPDFEGRNQANQPVAGISFSLSDVARARLSKLTLSPLAASQVDSAEQVGDAAPIDPRMRVLMDMILAITGQAVRVFDVRELQASPPTAVASPTGVPPSAASTPAPASQAESAGWGFELDTHQLVAESETTQVSAQGVVHTADGQQISFTLQIEMSRAFVQDSSSSIRAGDALRKDPLVINFGGNGVALTDTQFSFDLNSDGQQENIAFVAAGSGFLVLDKNKDGRVNDGTVLFGPRSGNGFADLAEYDQDGNQWIDENDAVYSQLKVWQRDASGKDSLRSLAQSGVGALYLGQVASPFSVNSSSNQNLGQVRSTGIFLYESGLVGTLQQVDL